MNKIFNKGLALVALLSLATSLAAADLHSYSFLNNNVSSILVSNKLGATNMISQVRIMGGHYWSNVIGAGSYFAYSNAIPFTTSVSNNFYGPGGILATQLSATLPGTLILDQKTNITSTWSYTGTLGVRAATNDPSNLFVDVPLPTDALKSSQPMVGGTQPTNSFATIAITTIGDTVFTSGTAGGGSNNVSFVFRPVPDGINESSFGTDDITLNFTNQSSVITSTSVSPYYTPSTYLYQLPSSRFIGCKNLRLVKIYTGDATNGLWVQSVTLNTWTP